MSKTMINPQVVEHSWVLNLTLNDTMTKDECLEIVKKLDAIRQNNFYTINIWDATSEHYYGNIELFSNASGEYMLTNTSVNDNSKIVTLTYRFYKDGTYARVYDYHGQISDMLSRLDKIEQILRI